MIPFVREMDFVYGRCEAVSPLIRRVVADNPGPFTYLGTGTYIVGRGEVAVIDPGPDLSDHLTALLAAVEGEQVTHILVTHDHADHSPLAAALKAATGAPIIGLSRVSTTASAFDDAPDHAFRPDIEVQDGQIFAGPGWTLEAVATPGHTANHVAYALAQENALFSGDHVMGWSTTVISPPDGDMAAYMQSLERVRARNFAALWPTHGPPITDPAPFLAAYVQHRQAREAQILTALAHGPATIGQLVPRLYKGVDKRLHPAAAHSMLAAMVKLAAEGRVAAENEPNSGVLYRLV